MNVVLITGGSRGIGASAAENCTRRGMGVILTYQSNRSAALSVLDRIESDGGQAVALEFDVEDITGFVAFRAAVQRELRAKWGRTMLYGLVNNAGCSIIEYALGDRRAQVLFVDAPQGVAVQITFDTESTHSLEQQRAGWQAILNNFKRYVEGMS